ncbi:MAG: gamma-glutamyl-gamma-aminobutyrate hydrolase family protein [Bdellovibrionales bacterium]
MSQPKIAVMMDEDTSCGGENYGLSKDYFSAISRAGGLPFGIPYLPEIVSEVIQSFDGFFAVGGSAALPDEWYLSRAGSTHPKSERVPVEIAIMKGFLERDKPVFGSCHGMQVLAGIHGCKLQHSVNEAVHRQEHKVTLSPNSRIFQITGQPEFIVNSRHREAVAKISDPVVAGAIAPDGTIEEIEVLGKAFAIGCQWHQENFWRENHPGNKLFDAFISAALKR